MRRHKFLTALALAGMTLAIACGGDDGTEPPPPADPPVVGGVSLTTVSPGDTLIITGSNFSGTAGENTVTFWNPLSATPPYQATETELRVVVDRDATSGPVTVATAGGSDKGDSLTVVRDVGDFFVFGGLGANNILSLPNPTATTSYLVIPHGASTGINVQADLAYSIQTNTSLVALASAGTRDTSSRSLHTSPNDRFEAQRWENAADTYARYGAPREMFDRQPALAAQVAPQFRQFYVLRTACGDQNIASSYARITAQLRHDGSKCLVYADVDTLPTGNFTQTTFDAFGQAFDNSIEATNTSYFGTHSDVDGNDRVILLVSPRVNRLEERCPPAPPLPCGISFIAGFFNPRDLYASPPVPAGTTNHAEILYLLAADPTGVWDCEFDVAATASENLGTITHEHEHLISFSHRLFYQGGTFQVTWLEEGMAHMAEDLNGDNSSNAARGKRYRSNPGAISLEDSGAPLEQRGGIYLMLRLLADRYGTGFLKTMVQSKCTGRACIQNVTGMGFYDVLAEFLAAQYLSGRGITDDERFNYKTPLNFTNDQAPNYFGPLLVGLETAGGPAVSSKLRRSSGDFHFFTGLNGQISRFQFADSSAIGLRSVIMRTQ